jgi:hypothetical protein
MYSRQAQGLFSYTIYSCAWAHSMDRTECRCYANDGCHGDQCLAFDSASGLRRAYDVQLYELDVHTCTHCTGNESLGKRI